MANRNPDTPGHPTFRPQNPLRVEDMRRIWRDATSSQKISTIGGDSFDIGGDQGGQGSLDSEPLLFWARLIAQQQDLPLAADSSRKNVEVTATSPTSLYSFIEVQDYGTGTDWISWPGAIRGTYNAQSIDGSKTIAVPQPPSNLTGGTGLGSGNLSGTLTYVVTAVYDNIYTGDTGLQSTTSNELLLYGTGSGTIALSWDASPTAFGYILTGYQIWRGTSSGNESVLVDTVGPTITTYTDDGIGGSQTSDASPIIGGNAGPVVLMSPYSAAWDFFKFVPPSTPTISQALAFVKCISITEIAVTLPSGDTLVVYEGIIESWDGVRTDGTNALWTIGDAVWIRGFTGEVPALNQLYPCRLFGIDENNIPIWITKVITAFIKCTSITPTVIDLSSGLGTGTSNDTLIGYEGLLLGWDGATTDGTNPNWTNGETVWIRGFAGETPALNQVYPCRLFSVDKYNVPIWVTKVNKAWVKVTSNVPNYVILPITGNRLVVYPAIINDWDGVTTDNTNPIWTSGAVVWFRGVNAEVPTIDKRYQCRLIGIDTSNQAIWATKLESATDTGPTINLLTKVCNIYGSGSGSGYIIGTRDEFTPVTLPVGATIGTPFCIDNLTNCCGSGSGSGGLVSCCPEPVPSILYASFTSNDCPGLNDVCTILTYNGDVGAPAWFGSFMATISGVPLNVGITLTCGTWCGIGRWCLDITCGSTNNPASQSTANVAVCNPFQLSFDVIDNPAGNLCCVPFIVDINTTPCSGSGSGGSGSGGSGPTFVDLCPGLSFNSTYYLTITCDTCPTINGTYTLTWDGQEWSWLGTIGGTTVKWYLYDSSGQPTISAKQDGHSAMNPAAATRYTCPPTFTASGGGTFLTPGLPLCGGDSFSWSVS